MKCKWCNKEIDYKTNQMGKHYYCDSCFPVALEDEAERKKLIDTIIKYYQIDAPTGFMFKQIQRMKNQNGWCYKNMRLTLIYVKEILNFDLNVKYGVSPIEYHHDDMLRYFKTVMNNTKKNQGIKYKVKNIKTSEPISQQIVREQKMKDLSKYGR